MAQDRPENVIFLSDCCLILIFYMMGIIVFGILKIYNRLYKEEGNVKEKGKWFSIMIINLFMVFISCNKHSYIPVYSKAQFNLKIQVETSLLEWETIKYTNAAGNAYGVTTINFYVSGIILKKSNGEFYSSDKVFYIDPSVPSKAYFTLDSIPPGTYTEISFLLGLDSAMNKTLALPATTDNINMAWPDMMGGGYHFLKFEGHYIDSAFLQKGFAVHLGKNENLPAIMVNTSMKQQYWDHQYSLLFDLNEIFTNPYTYDFNSDNNYTMMDSVAMHKITSNITDAFTLIQDN